MTVQRLSALLLLIAVPVVVATALAGDAPADVRIDVKDKTSIEFRHGNELSGSYHIGPNVVKPYMWPLNAPNGKPLTRSWPLEKNVPGEKTDHKHQKSLWFCHGDVIPEGITYKKSTNRAIQGIDFWTEDGNFGRIVCVKVGEPVLKKNHGQIMTQNEWRSADDVKVMDETRTLHLIDFGDAQLFVFDIDLFASVAPITFGDTKEGSFGLRAAQSITVDTGKGKLTNAEGKSGEGARNNADLSGCWGVLSAWCDYSGTIDGATAGVTIFADPTNRYASCWQSRGYGLMSANPFARDKSGYPAMKGKTDVAKLAKGEHLKLRYGVLMHNGDVKEGKVAEYYQRFVNAKD